MKSSIKIVANVLQRNMEMNLIARGWTFSDKSMSLNDMAEKIVAALNKEDCDNEHKRM